MGAVVFSFGDLAQLPANVSEILRGVRKILRNQETQMSLADDQRAAIEDLKAEDGVIIAALDDLAAKASSAGSVSDAEVQASIDSIRSEIDRIHTAVVTDDPDVTTPPTV
jgi:hypothetical protein